MAGAWCTAVAMGIHETAAPLLSLSAEQDPGTHLAFLPLPALSTELFLAGSLGVSGRQARKLLPTQTRHQA